MTLIITATGCRKGKSTRVGAEKIGSEGGRVFQFKGTVGVKIQNKIKKRITCTGYNERKKSDKLQIITSDKEDRGRIENIKFYSINNEAIGPC